MSLIKKSINGFITEVEKRVSGKMYSEGFSVDINDFVEYDLRALTKFIVYAQYNPFYIKIQRSFNSSTIGISMKKEFDILIPKSWLPYVGNLSNLNQLKIHSDAFPGGSTYYVYLHIGEDSINEYKRKYDIKQLLTVDNALDEKFDNNEIVDKMYDKIAKIKFHYVHTYDYDDHTSYEVEQSVQYIEVNKNGIFVHCKEYNRKYIGTVIFSDFQMDVLPSDCAIKSFARVIMNRLKAVGVDSIHNVYEIQAGTSYIKPQYKGMTYGDSLPSIKLKIEPAVTEGSETGTTILFILQADGYYVDYIKKPESKLQLNSWDI